MKNFLLGVIVAFGSLGLYISFKPKNTLDQELSDPKNKIRRVVFILHNSNLDYKSSKFTCESKYGKSTVVIFKHGADVEDAILKAEGSDKKFVDVLNEID